MKVEIGVPVYNEESGISEFLVALQAVILRTKKEFPELAFQLLLLNDGSNDATVEKIQQFRFSGFSRVRLISFSRNYGHPAAVSAIIDHADGNGILLMDSDFQDDPGIIPELVHKWSSGYQSVQVVRTRREESVLFRFCHFIFSRIFRKLSGLRSDVGTFGIYDRTVVQAIRAFPERLRYIPGIISSVGFKNSYVYASRGKRLRGESRVGMLRLIRLGFTAWLSYSAIPIHFITGMGFLISFLALFAGVLVIGIKITTQLAIPGWASLLSAQFFLGGLIILALGVVGQYVGIIFEEVKHRPIYLIASEDELHRE